MKSVIITVRWLFSILFGILLSAVVFITPLTISLSSALSQRETLKVWVQESGIYEHTDEIAVEILKEQAQSSSESEQLDAAEEILSEHNLEQILKDVLTPTFSQELLEGAIDGTYDYLEGKTEGIVIKADKEKVQDAFIQILFASSGIEFDSVEQLKNLPTCTPAQEENLDEGFEDIEDACLPKDFVLDQIFESQPGQQNGDSFDITGGGIDTTEIEENFPARGVFQIVKLSGYLLISVIVFLAAATILLVPGWKKAFIFTGVMGIIPSVFSLGLALFIYFAPALITPLTTDFSPQNSQLVESSSQIIIKDIFGRDILYSLLLLVLFSAVALCSRLIKVKTVQTAVMKAK